jgi:Trypsin-co-occurring domain 1
MANYVQFNTADGSSILVEVDLEEVAPQGGVVKAGLAGKVQETAENMIAVAEFTFEEAIERMVGYNTQAFIKSIRTMPELPSEVEISFGVKATGELGNLAICKVGGEANYNVKLAWKQLTPIPNDRSANSSSVGHQYNKEEKRQ